MGAGIGAGGGGGDVLMQLTEPDADRTLSGAVTQ